MNTVDMGWVPPLYIGNMSSWTKLQLKEPLVARHVVPQQLT